MLHLLSEAGRSFLRAFGASLLIFLPGVLVAPNLATATGLAVGALVAALAAGFKAVQVFVPQLSFKSVFPAKYSTYALWVDSFARAFLSTFLVMITSGLYAIDVHALDLSTFKTLLVSILVGAVAAGFRVVQGLLTKGSLPAPQKGLETPPPTP